MIKDYSELMAQKQVEMTKLNNSLEQKMWLEAMLISGKLEIDFREIYLFAMKKSVIKMGDENE